LAAVAARHSGHCVFKADGRRFEKPVDCKVLGSYVYTATVFKIYDLMSTVNAWIWGKIII
jgi:hypothetical protein